MAGKTDDQAREQVYNLLYEDYHEPIEQHLMMRVHNKELAADLCQDTFARLWKFLVDQKTAFKQTTDYKNWLYTVATNLAIDDYRHNKRIDFIALPENEEYAQFAELMTEGEAERTIELLTLKEGLAQLSPQYRKSLLMRYVGGHTEKETAAKLGIAEKTVSANVNRGRAQLNKKSFAVPDLEERRRVSQQIDQEISPLISGSYNIIKGELMRERLASEGFDYSELDRLAKQELVVLQESDQTSRDYNRFLDRALIKPMRKFLIDMEYQRRGL